MKLVDVTRHTSYLARPVPKADDLRSAVDEDQDREFTVHAGILGHCDIKIHAFEFVFLFAVENGAFRCTQQVANIISVLWTPCTPRGAIYRFSSPVVQGLGIRESLANAGILDPSVLVASSEVNSGEHCIQSFVYEFRHGNDDRGFDFGIDARMFVGTVLLY